MNIKSPFSAIQSFVTAGLKLAFPNSCLICEKWAEWAELMCEKCLYKLKSLPSLKIKNQNFDLEIFSRFLYQGKIKSLVQQKYSNKTADLFKAGKLLAQALPEIPDPKDWVAVSVPLHWSRKVKRGFNQSNVIAQGFCQETNIKLVNALRRNRATKYQSVAGCKVKRAENVKSAFGIKTWPIIGPNIESLRKQTKNKSIFLIDDLCTSGATLLECAKVLNRELKPNKIAGLTLARA